MEMYTVKLDLDHLGIVCEGKALICASWIGTNSVRFQ